MIARAVRRLLELLGLVLEEVTAPVTDPMAAQPDIEWCNYSWPACIGQLHTCDLEVGHGGGLHACACGEDVPTDQAVGRLVRALKLPPRYDDCLWPEDGVCPRHDRAQAWPAGRDCLGTCTVCNSPANAWHAPNCPHYDPEAIAHGEGPTP